MTVEAISPALPALLAWAELDTEERMSPIAQQAFRAGWEAAGRSAEPVPVDEQPMPKPGAVNVTPVARTEFLEMLAIREQRGIETYGRTLQTQNGRDAVRDAMEELIDAWQYVVQIGLEREDLIFENADLKAEVARLGGRP